MAPSQADVNIKIVFFPGTTSGPTVIWLLKRTRVTEGEGGEATTAENFNLLRRPDNGPIVDMNLSLRPSNLPNPIYNVRIFEGLGGRDPSTSRIRGLDRKRERWREIKRHVLEKHERCTR